jgi:HK97 gp10 family phage protein
MEVTGLDAILQNLMKMNINESLENKALSKAGEITKKAVETEANFSERSRGIYKKNIKLKRPKNGEVIIHSSKAYHAHLIEFGRSAGSLTTKRGKRVTWGSTAANPVFGRGFEQSKADALNTMISELQKGLGL